MTTHPQKITFGKNAKMRASGVRDVLIHCRIIAAITSRSVPTAGRITLRCGYRTRLRLHRLRQARRGSAAKVPSSARFFDPIVLPIGRRLLTLRDAATETPRFDATARRARALQLRRETPLSDEWFRAHTAPVRC